jgi:hypothetical protein
MAVQRGKSIGRLPLSVASGTNELLGFIKNEPKFIDIHLNELLQGAVERGEAGVAPAVFGNALKAHGAGDDREFLGVDDGSFHFCPVANF